MESPLVVSDPITPRPGYSAVLASPGFARLIGGATLARTGQQMSLVSLVLFTLARYHSPALAGLVSFALFAPGLAISPLAGALLDRHGRIRLITADYTVAAVTMGIVVALDHAGWLSSTALVIVVVLSGLTHPLSNTGTRSLFSLVLPRHVWDRANALDSAAFVVSMVLGPAIAGGLVAAIDPTAAILGATVAFLGAALTVAGVPEPQLGARHGRGVLADARAGIGYVLRSPSLRGLAMCLSIYNVGAGIVIVGLPVLVLRRLGGGGGDVGLLFALMGAGGLVGALAAGSRSSEGRERHGLAGGMALSAVGLVIVLVAPSVWLVALGMAVFGLSSGPIDIGLFSMRQRRTHPEWLGRSFAVSAAMNFSGIPVGSAVGGPLAGASVEVAFGVAVVAVLAGAAVAWWLIPQRWEA